MLFLKQIMTDDVLGLPPSPNPKQLHLLQSKLKLFQEKTQEFHQQLQILDQEIEVTDLRRQLSAIGVCQGSCRVNHATLLSKSVNLTGFRATVPIGCQLRV